MFPQPPKINFVTFEYPEFYLNENFSYFIALDLIIVVSWELKIKNETAICCFITVTDSGGSFS